MLECEGELGGVAVGKTTGTLELEVCRLEEDATGELVKEVEAALEEAGFEPDGTLEGTLDDTTGADEGVWLGVGVELDEPTLEGEGVLDWET